MIPKNEMREGWYRGFCRNTYVAYWDERKGHFIHISYSFGPYIDTIEHFEDVKDKGFDGFVPVKRIESLTPEEKWKIKDEIGY
jgi:hypothetical protein